MEPLYIIGIVLIVAAIAFIIYRYFLRKPQKGGLIRLPLQLLGFRDIPAVAFSLEATAEAALKLAGRAKETSQALNGLSKDYTIQGEKANARSFLYGRKENNDDEKAREHIAKEMASAKHEHFLNEALLSQRIAKASPLAENARAATDSLTSLFMDAPEQFSLSWTQFNHVYDNAQPRLTEFSEALTIDTAGAEAATRLFWPLIANHGLAFNLLIPKKMPETETGPLAGKALYQIDMRFFEEFETTTTNGFTRFTPGAIIDLYQDPNDLNLVPYRIEVFKNRGAESQTYEYGPGASNGTTPSMWVYAIQAAKAAVTVWGIWLGHVYHWHVVTAALQFTMFETLKENHPVRQLLDPMSNYLIGFDNFLLLAFEHIAPPTSFKSGRDWIGLENAFANGRNYHDDDPIPTLERLGIIQDDFTTPNGQAWDKYPIVKYLLDLWVATEDYVTVYVKANWGDDNAVINDAALHEWLDATRDPLKGNVMGIPAMRGPKAQKELIALLTSYIFRITAHGSSRMNTAANPVLSFVANFPPCLQSDELYPPNHVLSQEELLRFLPNTGTIGSMLTFLNIFVFSAPYESFIPSQGIEQDLFFGDNDQLNKALIQFRRKVEAVLRKYDAADPMIHQWPRNIET